MNGSAWTQRIPILLAALAVVAAALTLAGWAFAVPRLVDWPGDGTSQMPNNAIGVAAAGAALLAACLGRNVPARILAAFTALIALATLFEHATGVNLGIDTLVLHRQWGQRGTTAPGRMGLPGATALAVLGLSILLRTSRRMRTAAAAGGLLIISITALSLIGRFFGADVLYEIPRFTTIAMQTSAMLLVLGVALVASVPDAAAMRLLVSDSAAGLLVRRALPAVVVLPMLLGWAAMYGQQARLFDTAFATALLVLLLVGLLAALLWWCAAAIAVHERAMRQGRDRLAGILGSITDAFMTVDANACLAFVNDASEAALGAPRAQLLGRSLWEVLPTAADGGEHEHLQRALRERISVDYETLVPATGRWFARRAYPTADGGLAIYSRDVTERKRAEEALRKSAAALVAADRMKDEFLATLSHELRTPLTAIVGWSEILLDSDFDAREQRMALETIRASAKAQAQLVEDVLDVSRVITGKMRLERKEADLAAIVDAAVATVRPAAEAKRIAVGVSVDGALPAAFVDAERVQQVVWNLLSNAIKFSSEGTRVEVRLRVDGDAAVIEVTDQGCGIAPQFLPHLFERFRQADSSSSRSHAGLGIGLALSKDLVELHGGTIAAQSDGPGRGSCFTVRIPLGSQYRSTVRASGERAAAAAALDGVRVLYVDDREDARTLIAAMLRQHGAEVLAAASVQDALQAITSAPPSVVVTDLAMPEHDGYALLSAIRSDARWKQLPVLALTAQARLGDEARAAHAGFHAFLRKPIGSQELSAAIARAVAGT